MSLSEIPDLESGTILQGDVLEQIKKFPDKKFQSGITSPPYFMVRDYGIDGQWGLEKDPLMYLDRLDSLMRSVWRVLKDDGIFWVNLGDCIIDGSWYGFPEMFFSNCRKAGWKSVTKAIWWKRNAMPSSTKIRLSPRYEPVYGFAKKNNWYFDLDQIRVPLEFEKSTKPFNLRVREGKKGTLKEKYGKYTFKTTENEKQSHNKEGVRFTDLLNDDLSDEEFKKLNKQYKKELKQDSTLGGDGKIKGNYHGFNERWKRKMLKVPGQSTQGIHRKRHSGYYGENGEYLCNPLGKNPGDVLDITVKPFKGGHFATFPPELPEMLIKCSTKENDFVLDPFFGSGTVGLVAEKLKRKWCGIELNPKFIELARQRLKNFQP